MPVGSDAIVRRFELPFSSATIRNEMARLEEEGYISHPHTSAGRVPSDKGYRYYVEALMQERDLPPEVEADHPPPVPPGRPRGRRVGPPGGGGAGARGRERGRRDAAADCRSRGSSGSSWSASRTTRRCSCWCCSRRA